jgi:hypothetical protein
MDTRFVVGILLLFVVAFFGYQWWRYVSNKHNRPSPMYSPVVASDKVRLIQPSVSASKSIVDPNEYPEVAGQTESELRKKEPLQDTKLASQQEPVTHEGHGPAEFESNIQHPEQSFHQPPPSNNPKMSHAEIDSGRAVASPSSPSAGEQGFSPEMAQNDGPLVGNVYAFDGMEQTGFANF